MSAKTIVRVRFAPSPTGHLHIGGLRTALFNWLFARHHGGAFLLRIEDTDVQRSRPEYVASILDALSWASITGDEPVVMQTSFLPRHIALAHELLATGRAYRCFCPKQEYTEGEYGKYDARCRNRQPQPDDADKPFAIRIKLPQDTLEIAWDDLIRGHVSFSLDQLDDFIIVRSDGVPVYNFAVVADDTAMNITHVIRGEEHISNTPRQLILYQALGAPIPTFAHLPMILGPTGAKLSKRDAATSVLDYRAQGYLPDALCNYLVRLGWSYGDQEIFSREEMISYFSLESIGSKGAIFDKNKLDWVSGVYLRAAPAAALIQTILHDVDQNLFEKLATWSEQTVAALVALYKERCKTLTEMVNELVDLYQGKPASQQEIATLVNEQTSQVLTTVLDRLSALDTFELDVLQTILKGIAQEYGVKFVALAQPLRLALTGKTATPGIFELLRYVGKDESLRRIRRFLETIKHSV
jgi:glutamyl-tRNA synthetase